MKAFQKAWKWWQYFVSLQNSLCWIKDPDLSRNAGHAVPQHLPPWSKGSINIEWMHHIGPWMVAAGISNMWRCTSIWGCLKIDLSLRIFGQIFSLVFLSPSAFAIARTYTKVNVELREGKEGVPGWMFLESCWCIFLYLSSKWVIYQNDVCHTHEQRDVKMKLKFW